MARQLIMKMTDDLDRNKAAVITRTIGWEGYDYVLDLCSANDKKLAEALAPYLEAAHEKVKQAKPRKKSGEKVNYPPIALGREERDSVREWARNNGYEIGDKGIIKREIVAAYTEAHSA
ncbi:Lsr2-like DNA bridging protein [Mycobacterium phage Arissanae]|nr:Lsr2-like DNA bridging protein [Mycobacterium phage Arissanae]